jgi:lambda family phage portal protein
MGFAQRISSFAAAAWAFVRHPVRTSMQQLEAFGNSAIGGYGAGKLNHLTRWLLGSRANENGIPREALQRIRWAARDLWRNNPSARKICRSLEAKVIGRGQRPLPQATQADGTAHEKFRKRAQQLWDRFAGEADYRGKPGYGGQTLTGLMKVALRSLILDGETLYRFRTPSYRDFKRSGNAVPLKLQLIAADRLAEYSVLTDGPGVLKPGNVIFRGIQIDEDGIRQAYWILKANPGDPFQSIAGLEADAIPADQIGHLYLSDDVDQYRGVSWFAPVLMKGRDAEDYEYNELKASAIGACAALGIKAPTGTTAISLAPPLDSDLSDHDGNPITTLQPGMIFNLGADGDIKTFDPSHPNTNAEAWMNHLLRRIASGVPGVKSSTITGDYRNSSFSSERSADNDAWPEIQGLQDEVAWNLCQPIYERLVIAGIESGWFDGLVTPSEFASRQSDFLGCHWQGPIALSINPTDDAKGAKLRIECGISSLQREAAKVGVTLDDIFAEISDTITKGKAHNLPEDLIRQFLGLAPVVEAAEEKAEGSVDETDDGQAPKAKPAAPPTPALKAKPAPKRHRLDEPDLWMGPNGEDLSATRATNHTAA